MGRLKSCIFFSRQFVASQYFRKITSCDPVKLIILWLKANYPHSVAGFFSKILGCHELSRKHIHDFKRPMNQNLDFPLPPKCPLGIIEKSIRERIDNVVVKTNYQQSVADFSKTPHHELSRKIYTIWNDPWTKTWAIPQAPKCPLGILENRFESARIPGKIILGLTNIPHTDFGWRSGWTKTPAFF